MLKKETKQILAVFAAIFFSTAAVFGFLLSRAEFFDFEFAANDLPWWIFFAASFFWGATAGLVHISATMLADKARVAGLMKLHSGLWVAAVPTLVASLLVFWREIDLGWIWFLLLQVVPGMIILAVYRKIIFLKIVEV